jgi:hypothetical protein
MARKIWGTDNYTSNSDAICMLFHTQFMNYEEFRRKNFEFYSLFCQVAKRKPLASKKLAKKTYAGSEKKGFVSRKYALTQYQGHTLKPINVRPSAPLRSEHLQKIASKMTHVRPKKKNKPISNSGCSS